MKSSTDAAENVMTHRVTIYLFRDPHFARAGNAVACVAPVDAVVRAYGGGGINDTGGLAKTFGGAAVFRDDAGNVYLGVWGARKASKFRNALIKSGAEIEVSKERPPAKLAWYQTNCYKRGA
jgi:hypothetical protein